MTGVPVPALVLTRGEIKALMCPADYLTAVEAGFEGLHSGRAIAPAPLALELDRGGFHAKAASLALDRCYVAVKLNANFPGNPQNGGLPTIQGAILLCDGETGSLLAIMDSMEVTLKRTAAATALAAKHFARADSATVLICGCGDQATAQLEALRGVLPLRRGFCWDRQRDRAEAFGRKFAAGSMTPASDLTAAALESDVIVTCTTATASFLTAEMVRPGVFIAAVGADAPHKNEIAPELMAQALVVTDVTSQCAVMGDLHHAIEGGLMSTEGVHAEIGDIVAGARPGRTSPDQIILFDSTGVAVQDVAAAVEIYRRALAAGARARIVLGV